jgi:hypothetical protein
MNANEGGCIANASLLWIPKTMYRVVLVIELHMKRKFTDCRNTQGLLWKSEDALSGDFEQVQHGSKINRMT